MNVFEEVRMAKETFDELASELPAEYPETIRHASAAGARLRVAIEPGSDVGPIRRAVQDRGGKVEHVVRAGERISHDEAPCESPTFVFGYYGDESGGE